MTMQWLLAWRYLWTRKLRTTLTILAIVLGVALLFGLQTLMPSIMQGFRQSMMAATGNVDLVITHVTGAAFDQDALLQVQEIQGVARATGVLSSELPLPNQQEGPLPLTISLTGVDPASIQHIQQFPMAEGRFLMPGDQYAVVIPSTLAEKLGVKVGDGLRLPTARGVVEMTVVGILSSAVAVGATPIYAPLTIVQTLLNKPRQINAIRILYQSGVDPAMVESRIKARLGPNFQTEPQLALGAFDSAMQLGEQFLAIFGIMALFLAAFIIFITFRTLIAEQRRDMALLRTVGASRRTVTGIVFWQAMFEAILGTGVGLLAGYGLAWLMILGFNPLLREMMHIEIEAPVITASNVTMAVGLGVGISLLGGIWPALVSGKISPLEALSSGWDDVEAVKKGRSRIGYLLLLLAIVLLITGDLGLISLGALLMLIGLVLALPALVRPLARSFTRPLTWLFTSEGRIAQANLERQPNRAALTAATVMFSTAIVVAILSMIASSYGAFASYVDDTLGADFLILPSSLALSAGNLAISPEIEREIEAIDGVEAVATMRLSQGLVQGTPVQIVGIDPDAYPHVAGLVFKEGDEAEAFQALGEGRRIIVNGILASQKGIGIGDVIRINTPTGAHDYNVVAIALDLLNAKISTGYISQPLLASDFQETNDMVILVKAKPHADYQAMEQQLRALFADYPTFSVMSFAEFKTSMDKMIAQGLVFYYLIVLLMAIPALLAMMNTLTINVIERTREIGVLRAMGALRKQVQRMILAEALLMAMLGALLGAIAGIWLAYLVVAGLSFSGFVLTFQFPWVGITVALILGLTIGALAAALPARQAARLNIIGALRYE